MAVRRESKHGLWSSRTAFIFAATGSAVGLGNVWKFPYITGENGGGAFVLIYLVCILLIGIPVLIAEILIGRRARQNPVHAFASLAQESGASSAWSLLGVAGVLASFTILSYYVVIMSWAFAYIFYTGSGHFGGENAEMVGQDFAGFLSRWPEMIAWTTLMVVMTMIVVAGGVRRGLERVVSTMMPGIVVILGVLIVYSIFDGRFWAGFTFLFAPDFGEISRDSIIVALGHAFFTLSLASGAMVAYGAYVPQEMSIAKTGILIAIADTAVALMAGLAIFPLVFAYELTPSIGPGLIFATLPIAFGEMPFGAFFGTLFFIMLFLAAFTSAISLLEPSVVLIMERFGLTRTRAVGIVGSAIWLCSMPTVLSQNVLSGFHPIGVGVLKGKTIFDILDFLTSNVMLPLGGFFTALFTAWIMSRESTRDELAMGASPWFAAWHFVLRYIAPIAIVIIFLNLIGVLKF